MHLQLIFLISNVDRWARYEVCFNLDLCMSHWHIFSVILNKICLWAFIDTLVNQSLYFTLKSLIKSFYASNQSFIFRSVYTYVKLCDHINSVTMTGQKQIIKEYIENATIYKISCTIVIIAFLFVMFYL